MNLTDALARPLGARPLDDGRCRFTVWAPRAQRVDVQIGAEAEWTVPLQRAVAGYFSATVQGVKAGDLYRFSLDGGPPIPDPASRLQPLGVMGPSQVIEPTFPWTDDGWRGVEAGDLVLYEFHVGTFTPEGTFSAAAGDLPRLRELGITAMEIMPVSAFSGSRNWGYDGVFPYAVQATYGGPTGLQQFVDACHRQGMAVILDMVYNHLGPEGNVLMQYGPYFTDRYHTPWGVALNFDGRGSDQVRRYFIEQARTFLSEYHLDGFRLDAVSTIMDSTPKPFLEEYTTTMHRFAQRVGRPIHVIAEDDRNDPRLVRPAADGGLGFDAVWNDDFHHAVHAYLTGERQDYYRDFGALEDLSGVLAHVFSHPGRISGYRGRRHGRFPKDLTGRQFVTFIQNHDQVGNRSQGERLSRLIPFEAQKMAAGLNLLSPFCPMLFMGEEYGEPAPFLYFTSHENQELVAAVREGRRREFEGVAADPPDPQAPATFTSSKLAWPRPTSGQHGALSALYKRLMALRHELPLLRSGILPAVHTHGDGVLAFELRFRDEVLMTLVNASQSAAALPTGLLEGPFEVLLDTAHPRWLGPGFERSDRMLGEQASLAPFSLVLLRADHEGGMP